MPTPHPAQPSPDAVRRMFGAIVPTYDCINRLMTGGRDQRWRRQAARAALDGLTPCRRVLDLATGTGDLAAALAREAARLGERPIIVGADFARPMLQRARAKFPDATLVWIEADALRLPWPDGAFDALTIGFGLRNMADKLAALAEMARVLRPGGRAAILESSRPRSAWLRWGIDGYTRWMVPVLGRWLSRSDAYRYLAESMRCFWTDAELAAAMRAAGFEAVRSRAFMGGAVGLHVGVRAAVGASA